MTRVLFHVLIEHVLERAVFYCITLFIWPFRPFLKPSPFAGDKRCSTLRRVHAMAVRTSNVAHFFSRFLAVVITVGYRRGHVLSTDNLTPSLSLP